MRSLFKKNVPHLLKKLVSFKDAIKLKGLPRVPDCVVLSFSKAPSIYVKLYYSQILIQKYELEENLLLKSEICFSKIVSTLHHVLFAYELVTDRLCNLLGSLKMVKG